MEEDEKTKEEERKRRKGRKKEKEQRKLDKFLKPGLSISNELIAIH